MRSSSGCPRCGGAMTNDEAYAKGRADGLEAAAKACDERSKDGPESMTSEAMLCAAYIRALSPPPSATVESQTEALPRSADYNAGFHDGCLAMREAAAEKIKSGRVAINTMHVSQELIRNDPVSAIQLIAADAELATRLQIVQVIRELALPEK